MNYFEKRYNSQSIDEKNIKYDFWRYGKNLGKKLDDYEIAYVFNTIINILKKNSKVKKINLIDLGCGTGYHSIQIFKKLDSETSLEEIKVFGIDRNENYTRQFICNIKNDHDFFEKEKYFQVKQGSVDIIEKLLFEDCKDDHTINIVVLLGVIQYLSYKEIKRLSKYLGNSSFNDTHIIIKHPLSYGSTIIKEETREGAVYNSEYKKFEDVYRPFSDHFNFIKMQKCYLEKELTLKEELEISPNKDTCLVYIHLKNK